MRSLGRPKSFSELGCDRNVFWVKSRAKKSLGQFARSAIVFFKGLEGVSRESWGVWEIPEEALQLNSKIRWISMTTNEGQNHWSNSTITCQNEFDWSILLSNGRDLEELLLPFQQRKWPVWIFSTNIFETRINSRIQNKSKTLRPLFFFSFENQKK